jgi:formylglycine-generating enzyme required for sulfatase activity
MKRLGFLLALSCALSGVAQQSRELGSGRNRIALVVGNDAYTGSLSPLSNAVSDARAMGTTLKAAGFHVTVVVNANREALDKAVDKFIDSLDRGDVALFYYSGHGLQVRDENYLAPVDLVARDAVEARHRTLNAMEVLDRMDAQGTDLQIMILDACRNNPYGGRGQGTGLAPMKNMGKGTFIAYSTAPGQTASDGAGQNGLYTSELLKAIRKPGLTLEEVFKQAAEAVQKASGGGQIPFMSSSVSGNFYFNITVNVQLPPAPAPSPAAPARPLPAPTVELRYGSLAVSSDQGGMVYVDGSASGQLQPYAVLNFAKLPAGPHQVRVEKPGFQSAEQQVIVMPDQKASAELKLLSLAPSKPQGPQPGQTRVNPKDGQTYVWIPPGTFEMGCSPGDAECYDSEKPVHRVTISRGFWLGQTPATVGAFKRYAQQTGKAMPPEGDSLGRKLNAAAGNDSLPVVFSTWDEATAFCQWSGGRLPTEAEWEYSARAGTTASRYGNLDEIAWYANNSGNQRIDSATLWNSDQANYGKKLYENGNGPKPVGVKQPNPWRLYDMLGNVWQWVSDYYGGYQVGEQQDPAGPPSGQLRVLRGGSWGSNPRDARVSGRGGGDAGARNSGYGFRCAGELP